MLYKCYTVPGTTWANEMNFVMNRASGAGLICCPAVQRATTELQMPPNHL